MRGEDKVTDCPASSQREGEATLESMLIEEYLRNHGCTFQGLSSMASEEARQLLGKASEYASGRLAEIETRARLAQEIHRRTGKPE